MKLDFEGYDIYIRPGATDMRKRAESLSFLVRSEMGRDPLSRSVFLFCGRDRRRMTALVWDGNGWLELTKKLMCRGGRYRWPSTGKAAECVSADDVREMLRGGDPWRRFPSFGSGPNDIPDEEISP